MTPIHMERLEAGVRTIIAFNEALNQRNLPAMLKLISPECVLETPGPAPNGEILRGKTFITQYWQEFFSRFPQVHIKIDEAFGFGVRCVSRWSSDRTDAAGMVTHLRGVDLFRVENSLITEQRSYVKG